MHSICTIMCITHACRVIIISNHRISCGIHCGSKKRYRWGVDRIEFKIENNLLFKKNYAIFQNSTFPKKIWPQNFGFTILLTNIISKGMRTSIWTNSWVRKWIFQNKACRALRGLGATTLRVPLSSLPPHLFELPPLLFDASPCQGWRPPAASTPPPCRPSPSRPPTLRTSSTLTSTSHKWDLNGISVIVYTSPKWD